MHDFLQLILHMLHYGFRRFLAVAGICLLLVGIAYLVYRRKHQPGDTFPWGKALVFVLLAGYTAVLLYVTLLRQVGGGSQQMNLHLFLAWREAWNNFSLQNWLNVLLNIALFLPLGFLLPFLGKAFQSWATPVVGLAVSLAVETAQYLLERGMFDVDDLFTNSLGALLGFCFAMLLLRLFPGRGKSRRGWAPYLACPVAFGVFLLGLFGWYAVKPYGNLREASAYTYDLRGLNWQVQCQLDDAVQLVPTYWAEPFTKETCEVFGAEFARTAGIEFPDAYYYDDLTIFSNHSTGDFLNVTYHDRSYEYSASSWGLTGTEGEEETLRGKLAAFGIQIPAQAEFTYEGDGWLSFAVDLAPVGDQVVYGTLRCEYLENGRIGEIENAIVTLSPYREEEVISAREAFDRLQRGKFQGAEGLARLEPEGVRVLSCALTYRSDTKGCYQPVYEFLLEPVGADIPGVGPGTYLIPAMK